MPSYNDVAFFLSLMIAFGGGLLLGAELNARARSRLDRKHLQRMVAILEEPDA